jgi:hypothetical protein
MIHHGILDNLMKIQMMMTFFLKLVGQQSDSMYICLKRYVFSFHGDI